MHGAVVSERSRVETDAVKTHQSLLEAQDSALDCGLVEGVGEEAVLHRLRLVEGFGSLFMLCLPEGGEGQGGIGTSLILEDPSEY